MSHKKGLFWHNTKKTWSIVERINSAFIDSTIREDFTLGVEGTLGSDSDTLQGVEYDESVGGADGHEAPLGGEPYGVDASRGGHLDEGGGAPHPSPLHLARLPLERRVTLPREALLQFTQKKILNYWEN